MTDHTVDLDILTRAFPASAIKQRSGGGGRMLDYVEGHTVIHRLNEATGNNWEMAVRSISRQDLGGGRSLMTAHVALTLPGLGTREHIGIQEVTANAGDLVKGAVTDALKKAATLFGVGLELYGPDYEAGEVDAAPAPLPAPRPQAAARPAAATAAAAAADSGDLITDGQKKMVFRLMKECERKLGMDKAAFKGELRNIGYPDDDRLLTRDQASRAITWFKDMLGEETSPEDPRPHGVQAAVASDGEVAEIPF